MAKSFPGFVRIKERFPYAGKGPEAVAMGINAAFKQFARPQKLTLEAGENSILIEHLVPEEEGKKLTVTWHESIRTKPMDEYPALASVAAMLTYSFAVDNMAEAGFELCHVLIGSRNVFSKWLGVRLAKVNNLHVFGTPATIVTDIPTDVFVLCGAQSRDADAAEVLYSIKVAIP